MKFLSFSGKFIRPRSFYNNISGYFYESLFVLWELGIIKWKYVCDGSSINPNPRFFEVRWRNGLKKDFFSFFVENFSHN